MISDFFYFYFVVKTLRERMFWLPNVTLSSVVKLFCKFQVEDIQVSPTADENSKRINAKMLRFLKIPGHHPVSEHSNKENL